MSESLTIAGLFWLIVAGCFFHVVRTELREWRKRRAAGTPKPTARQSSEPEQSANDESKDKAEK